MNWRDYQEESASFFRALGLESETDVVVKGVRTKHNVDVLVRSRHAGFAVTWIVECKQWQTAVTKVHVLALREIVSDTGADRGILLSESGFQSGASEAAALTNVQLTSLAKMKLESTNEIGAMRLRDLFDRVVLCKERYWDISKATRIKHGLRNDVGGFGYSGDWAIKAVEEILSKSMRGIFPFELDELVVVATQGVHSPVCSIEDAIDLAESLVSDLEEKLSQVPDGVE